MGTSLASHVQRETIDISESLLVTKGNPTFCQTLRKYYLAYLEFVSTNFHYFMKLGKRRQSVNHMKNIISFGLHSENERRSSIVDLMHDTKTFLFYFKDKIFLKSLDFLYSYVYLSDILYTAYLHNLKSIIIFQAASYLA